MTKLTDKIKRLASEYAHCYAFVGDDTMPLKRKELFDAIDAIAVVDRVAFEAWVRSEPYFAHVDEFGQTPIDRDGEGYEDSAVHAAWMGAHFALGIKAPE